MTFRELDLYLRGALQQEARMVLTGAWLGASWQRSKRMPSLASALGKLAGRRRKGWKQQLDYVRSVLIPAFGGQIQTEAPDGA